MKNGEVRDTQLTNLIAEELEFLLGTARDPRLADLVIKAIDAKPGGKHFVIYVAPAEGLAPFQSAAEMQAFLKKAAGYLRFELANSLNLKRAPDLTILPYPM